ncbi:MAG TPA: tetratricopeptide repeat protein [Pyrinomonadaceae bacterium]|nr:tetratricopeptide repeat protein [Pyrinomonadaceae bacterium]
MRYFSILLISLLLTTSSTAQELTSAEEYSQRGIARFQNNDLDGAIADFTKVIELNGRNQEFCYYFRGMAHYRKGNSTQAIDDLTKAIAIKPDPRFFDDRGNLLAKQGELDRALADLNKAIEIAPQTAKAYGDRGLLRLMRGEPQDADLDFKKCFELDSALEPEFKLAANKIKQHAVSRYLREKPTDLEIEKFSWTEAPAKLLMTPSSGTTVVTTSAVSPTGTRVLADPNAKGESGPGEILNPSGIVAPPRTASENTKEFMAYTFTLSLKNTGTKTIVSVKWAYFFDPKDPARDGLAYLFVTKMNLSSGKEKTLNDSITSSIVVNAKLPSKRNQSLYNERVAILRLDYADGTSWQSPADTGAPQKPNNR